MPPEHRRLSPERQYSPGAQAEDPVRVASDAAPSSGVEYQPAATGSGAPEAGGQYTVAFPQAAAVPLTEPAGQ